MSTVPIEEEGSISMKENVYFQIKIHNHYLTTFLKYGLVFSDVW